MALALLVLSAWLGSKLGARIAVYKFRSDQKKNLGPFTASEHAHLESLLAELQAAQIFRVQFFVSANDDELKKTLPEQVAKFESFEKKTTTAEAKPVLEMDLAFAEVATAITEEQANNKDQSEKYMKSAQLLLQSLGWTDCSGQTLRAGCRTLWLSKGAGLEPSQASPKPKWQPGVENTPVWMLRSSQNAKPQKEERAPASWGLLANAPGEERATGRKLSVRRPAKNGQHAFNPLTKSRFFACPRGLVEARSAGTSPAPALRGLRPSSAARPVCRPRHSPPPWWLLLPPA